MSPQDLAQRPAHTQSGNNTLMHQLALGLEGNLQGALAHDNLGQLFPKRILKTRRPDTVSLWKTWDQSGLGRAFSGPASPPAPPELSYCLLLGFRAHGAPGVG